MNIPEEFGNYLLLKKLREDALGETFRAGRVGREGIEQVVLLRVFNGPGLDGEKLWQKVAGRAAVQQALRSPNIGSGVDLGKIRSFPYVAYDYVSGKNLATLVAQAARQHQLIPVDHALLVAERLALALAAAYETRVQDERVLHGFVVPHLVMISNEGEARLLGFEVAPGLRELWGGGWRDAELGSYLAPEAATGGAAVGRADDVYSLGAILFELLSSERLPAAPAGGYGPLIDALVLPGEGTPLPAGIAALLKQSLVPREQRIGDAVTWHKTISKLMIEGSYSSTTFNLAFFMHSLFRDEIDRESHEIEAEKKLELPRRDDLRAVPGPAAPAAVSAAVVAGAAGAAAGAAGAAADMRERTGVRDAAWAGGAAGAGGPAGAAGPAMLPASAGKAAGGSRTPLWIGLAAALVVVGLGAFFLFGRGSGAKPAAQPAPPVPGGPAGAAGAAGAANAAANAAALQAQIQQMIEARSKEMESKLKGQYDDQIHQLQQKLDESRRTAAAEQERERGRGERQAAAPSEPATGGAAAAETVKPRTEPAVPAATSRAAAAIPPPGPVTQHEPAGGGAAAVPSAPAAASAPPTAPPSAPAATPQIQIGDLVQPGPGVVLPKPLGQPEPRYPPGAKRMNRRAEVVVRVLVDEHGRVQQAERVGDPAGLGFDEAAIEAARRTTYVPATKDGVRVKIWYTMKINFVPEH